MATLIALLVFVVALLTALGVLSAGHLLWWCIAALALAVLLCGGLPSWVPRRS